MDTEIKLIMNNIRKTQRKNKTNQTVVWPSNDVYFTIGDLIKLNQHMLTSAEKPSDITLRVRLSKAIKEQNLVAVIGQRNTGKGRPQLVFSMIPVKKSVLDTAATDGISTIDSSKLVTVMEISSLTVNPSAPTSSPVNNVVSQQTVIV